jgi:hypothetical protein
MEGCDSRTRETHAQRLKISFYAVFARISAEFTWGTYTAISLNIYGLYGK